MILVPGNHDWCVCVCVRMQVCVRVNVNTEQGHFDVYMFEKYVACLCVLVCVWLCVCALCVRGLVLTTHLRETAGVRWGFSAVLWSYCGVQ